MKNFLRIFLPVFIFLLYFCFCGFASGLEFKFGEQVINFSSYFQFRYQNASTKNLFSVPRARTDIWGDLSSSLGYFFELDAVSSPAIIYGWIDFKLNENSKLRVGRFFYPFGLEYTTPPSKFETILPSITFWNLFGYSRDNGIQFSQKFENFKYFLALTNGAENEFSDNNLSKDIFARAVFDFNQNLSLGASFHKGSYGPEEESKLRVGAEVNLKLAPFNLKGEYLRANDNGIGKSGWYFQPSYWINPSFQTLIRYELWQADLGKNIFQKIVTFGVNWVFTPFSKLQINLEEKEQENKKFQNTFLTQLQVEF